MTANTLRCGIIGFDFGHQLAFASALAGLDRVEIAGAACLSGASPEAKARGEDWAGEQRAPYMADWRKLVERQNMDFVSVCAPPARNPELIEALCARGLHVMSEKPIAADMEGVKRIAAAVGEAGVRFTFGYHAARFCKPISRAIAAIQRGEIGNVRVMNSMWLQTKGPRYTISVGEARRRKETGEPSVGELENFGGYVFLALNAMSGSKVRSVYAESDAFFYESYRIAGIDDMSLVTLEYDNGVVATAIVGRTTTKSMPGTDVRFEVIGSEGTIHVNHGLGDRIFIYGEYDDGGDPYERGGFEAPTFGRASHERYVADFVDAIAMGREPSLTIDDALAYQAILDAAHESARLHRPVRPSIPADN